MIRVSVTAACRIDNGKNRRGGVAETPRQQGRGVGLRQQDDVGEVVGPGRGGVAGQHRLVEPAGNAREPDRGLTAAALPAWGGHGASRRLRRGNIDKRRRRKLLPCKPDRCVHRYANH